MFGGNDQPYTPPVTEAPIQKVESTPTSVNLAQPGVSSQKMAGALEAGQAEPAGLLTDDEKNKSLLGT